MFIELVEHLRCVREHEESWLVASIEKLSERSIIRGTLGCPVCEAEYRIAEGVADFSGDAAPITQVPASPPRHSAELALRAGAFLGLGDRAGTVVLGGLWTDGASELGAATGARVFAANGPEREGSDPGVGRILVSERLPFGASSCAGVALDDSFGFEALKDAERIVRPGGRIVGPVTLARPASLSLLAEDDEWWVAEKPAEVTTLRRGNR